MARDMLQKEEVLLLSRPVKQSWTANKTRKERRMGVRLSGLACDSRAAQRQVTDPLCAARHSDPTTCRASGYYDGTVSTKQYALNPWTPYIDV